MWFLVLHHCQKQAYGSRLVGPFSSEDEAWSYYAGRAMSPAERREMLEIGVTVEQPKMPEGPKSRAAWAYAAWAKEQQRNTEGRG